MGWLPGWNSAESAGWWSSFHFWFGIACLFLLGGSEVLSHFYALRKEELVAVADSALAAQRHQSQRETDDRRAVEMTALQQKAFDAENALTKLRNQQIPRKLSPQQQADLTIALLPFKGQKFTITSVMSDDEGGHLVDQIVSVTDAAGWDHGGGEGISMAMFTKAPIGIEIQVSAADAQVNQTRAAEILINALVRFGLLNSPQGSIGQNLQPGQIGIIVGRKPPPAPKIVWDNILNAFSN